MPLSTKEGHSMHVIQLPLYVQVTNKTRFYLNLNQYRNAHYHTLNKAKTMFKEAILDQVRALPQMDKIGLVYTLYPRTKQLCDVSNVCSIVDKFLSDVLTECGKIPDDNYQYISKVSYKFGSIDPINPRVEVSIYEN